MAWLARSIANSLRLEDDDDDDDDGGGGNNGRNITKNINAKDEQIHQSDPSSPSTPERGVKEDLSKLGKTLTRQFWGVASFLAPPPASQPSTQSQISDSSLREASPSAETADPEASDSAAIAGIRSDFAEIGGKFRSGISKLSNNIAVSEFTKIASNFLQLGSEQEGFGSAGGAIGVTDEVVAFARDIAMHPETWLDFPLPEDDDDDDEFDMSDAQQEHALSVEQFAPRLAALRIGLCPGYMSEGSFWKIYFVLLHPRLNKHDALLLSTPQILKARALLTQDLWKRTKTKPEQDWPRGDASYLNEISTVPHETSNSAPSNVHSESMPLETSAIELTTSLVDADVETEKHPVQITEISIIDKSVVEEGPVNRAKKQDLHSDMSSRVLEEHYEDDADDWLKEESSKMVGTSGTTIPIENEEDVSFSDLEDDDGDIPVSYKKVAYDFDSTKDSRDWVQLSRSSTGSTKDIDAVSVDRAGPEQVSAHNPEVKESNDWLDVDDIEVE